MGARGPIPEPNSLKMLKGNPGRRPLRSEVKAQPKTPPQPRWALQLPGETDDARRVRTDAASTWRYLTVELERLGLVGRIDRDLIADYCVLQARLLQVERVLSREGLVVGERDDRQRHPLLIVANQLRTALARRMTLLGIGATSRARLTLPDPDEDDCSCINGFGTHSNPFCEKDRRRRSADAFD